jgi:hypothetical protein
MDINTFWEIIEQSKQNTNGDIYLQLDNLREALRNLSKNDLIKAQEIFSDLMDKACKWDLWAAAYTIQGGCSDDGFIDFRAWLIGRGKDIYNAALENSFLNYLKKHLLTVRQERSSIICLSKPMRNLQMKKCPSFQENQNSSPMDINGMKTISTN